MVYWSLGGAKEEVGVLKPKVSSILGSHNRRELEKRGRCVEYGPRKGREKKRNKPRALVL